MPRHQVIYDKTLKETQEWKFLYNKWRWVLKQPHSEEFKKFPTFYDWSMAKGYMTGAKLERLDATKPFSPKNCLWVHPAIKQRPYTEEDMEMISRWNKTVNRIRRHFGMPPLK